MNIPYIFLYILNFILFYILFYRTVILKIIMPFFETLSHEYANFIQEKKNEQLYYEEQKKILEKKLSIEEENTLVYKTYIKNVIAFREKKNKTNNALCTEYILLLEKKKKTSKQYIDLMYKKNDATSHIISITNTIKKDIGDSDYMKYLINKLER